ncbi:DUF1579 domain-containing protein [Flavobacterium sp. SH_e]|uniref:DUF1579 domain-containing protein n=1 Tax=Flavobacterium TaxID=237 RepID=UPI0021E4ABAD|nr:DUF1579 domain-containing protein [Flavobacterium sp. SH_e]MCV2485592.1 DUF1579 domain-containing protein [Flavobacterium sp. SH_e]
MKKLTTTLAIITLCFISCKKEVKAEESTPKLADSVKTEEPVVEEPLDSAAQMKAWAAYATPSDAHKILADEVGTWNCDMTFWSDANAKPEKETSVAEIKMILGGRFQEAIYKGTMMGQPFEGKGIVGYNNATKEYISTFIDNMGTGMMTSTGKYNESTKSIEYFGEMADPVTAKSTKYREVYTIVDAQTRKMEMYDTKNGTEYKSMEIVMTKK